MVARHRRLEASDPATSPERLDELAHLPGDRGDIDSDSGWCRESVAGNPNASPGTLTELADDMGDFLVRSHVAANPGTPASVVEKLAEDPNDFVANAARRRLGLALRTVKFPTPHGPMMITPASIWPWVNTSTGKKNS